MKKLPLGIQTFEKIIKGNYLYVDKTKYLYDLINENSYYFISRPRRFGKSLLISTLKEIFSGNKELFKDLWIYDKIEWEKYPIIHIDFSNVLYTKGIEEFQNSLLKMIKDISYIYNIKLEYSNFRDCFEEIINKLSKNNKVVILIDEYDKPIINFVDDLDKAKIYRDILKNFYETIKANDQYIKFVILTGVSKFSKVSVFSGLNNLTDITIDDKYSKLLGYTQEELEYYFGENINSLSNKFNVSKEDLLYQIKRWYNGYSWNGKDFLYNPYSILSLFLKEEFSNYWFTSGTPTFLIKLIKEKEQNIIDLESYRVDKNLFESFDLENINIISLLFQTGYLTIKQIDKTDFTYTEYLLSYPNLEVKESFTNHLLAYMTSNLEKQGIIINDIKVNLEKNNIEKVFEIIRSIYASIPNQIFIKDKESYYHTIFYLILSLLGTRIEVEINTNVGRIDGVIHTKERIYIVEFKIGKAEEGLKQIEENKYYEKYLSLNKKIILIGVGFNKRKKNIDKYIFKKLT